jgi:hypothetical protein
MNLIVQVRSEVPWEEGAPQGLPSGSVTIVVRPDALLDMEEAFRWYERRWRAPRLSPRPRTHPLARASLNLGRLERGEHSRGPEGDSAEAHAGRIVDCISYGGQHGFASRLAGSIGRQVGPLGIRISIH